MSADPTITMSTVGDGDGDGEGGASPAHVIIVGGGFAGLALVRRLAKARRRGRLDVRVTLIDRRNHHTFQPLLYQVATAGLQTQDVGISLRAILRHQDVEIRLGEVTGVDTVGHVVTLADGARLSYDHLVIAAGAITEDFGVPGVAEHAFGLKSLAEATMLRNQVLRRFEEASRALADGPADEGGTLAPSYVVADFHLHQDGVQLAHTGRRIYQSGETPTPAQETSLLGGLVARKQICMADYLEFDKGTHDIGVRVRVYEPPAVMAGFVDWKHVFVVQRNLVVDYHLR